MRFTLPCGLKRFQRSPYSAGVLLRRRSSSSSKSSSSTRRSTAPFLFPSRTITPAALKVVLPLEPLACLMVMTWSSTLTTAERSLTGKGSNGQSHTPSRSRATMLHRRQLSGGAAGSYRSRLTSRSSTPPLSAIACTLRLKPGGSLRRRLSERTKPASSPLASMMPVLRSIDPVSVSRSKPSPLAEPSNLSSRSGLEPGSILRLTSRRIAGLCSATARATADEPSTVGEGSDPAPGGEGSPGAALGSSQG